MSFRIASTALLIGAASFAGYTGAAHAADLGSDCCSDLEERIAELEATTASKGNRRMSLQISGQVSTLLMYWNNGEDRSTYIVDNAIQSSRFAFTGSAKINPNVTAGFRFEVQGVSAPSSNVTETDDDGGGAAQVGDGVLSVRQANWYLEHKGFGRVTVGRLEMATTAIAEIDLGGTDVIARTGVYFGNDLAVGGLPGSVNFDTFALGNFEFDRNNAVRLDTASLGGFVASASFGENERWDVTLRYTGEFSGFRLAAGVGYSVGTDVGSGDRDAIFDERRAVLGSASVMHMASGVFLSGAAARRISERILPGTDPEDVFWGLRGGVSQNWFGLGKTILFGEYQKWDNESVVGNAEIKGLGIIQNIDAASMELFLAYKNHSVDLANTDETHLVLSGARIRF